MKLDIPVSQIPLIGEAYSKKLEKLNISTLKELLYHIPSRFEDTSNVVKINAISRDAEGLNFTVKGVITEIENIYTRYGKKLTQAIIEDDTGSAEIIWFNQQYLAKSIPKDQEILISGKVSFENYIRPKFVSPSYEALKSEKSIHLGKLTPVYPETKGVTSKWLRARIYDNLKKVSLEEWLPLEILGRYALINLDSAIKKIHFPQNYDEYTSSIARVAFDEMLLIQLLMQEKRNIQRQETAQKIDCKKELLDEYIYSLPFTLTKGQQKSVNEILEDVSKLTPMNRLLEGEVGSGKTVVAGAAIYMALKDNKKVAVMAPTSILAKQHFDTFFKILKNLGFVEEDLSLVTNKSKINPDAKLFIGTQALLFQNDIIKEVALAVIDEQHRFGVHQRENIINQKGKTIHSLTMTATPIPRTLALTIYGDLDISYINELPKGRKEIMTRIVPKDKRNSMYEFIKKNLNEGRQAFIICPLVSLSDKLNVKSAEEEFERLKKEVFSKYRVILLHGQMKAGDKDKILEDFKNKEYDILVSTPVVEVGIDIPNANIMIIEGAERFGLAQLHQLRGRVGRGEHESYCFLLTTEADQEQKERLNVFSKNSSGLKIAEFDLQNRGPGEVYGVKQSGIPMLKAASLLDIELIKKTKMAANDILSHGIDSFPSIKEKLTEFKNEISKLN